MGFAGAIDRSPRKFARSSNETVGSEIRRPAVAVVEVEKSHDVYASRTRHYRLGFLADTISRRNFLFSRPRRIQRARARARGLDRGWQMAKERVRERKRYAVAKGRVQKEREGEVRRSPYSCIVARSIAFSTELNSTQQWRTQWAV